MSSLIIRSSHTTRHKIVVAIGTAAQMKDELLIARYGCVGDANYLDTPPGQFAFQHSLDRSLEPPEAIHTYNAKQLLA